MSLHPDTETGFSFDKPVLYLPVRVETKFRTSTSLVRGRIRSSNKELRVRIYPDSISVHKKAGLYSQDEIRAGKKYWATVYALDNRGVNDERRKKVLKNAFAQLSKVTGSARAQHLIKKLYNHDGLKSSTPKAHWSELKKEIIGCETATGAMDSILSRMESVPVDAMRTIVESSDGFSFVSSPCMSGYYGEISEVWKGFKSELLQNVKKRLKQIAQSHRTAESTAHSSIRLSDTIKKMGLYSMTPELSRLIQNATSTSGVRTEITGRENMESPLWALLTGFEAEIMEALKEEGDLYVILFNGAQRMVKNLETIQDTPVDDKYSAVSLFPFNSIKEQEEGWLPHMIYEAMPERYVVHVLDSNGVMILSIPGNKVSITEENLAEYFPKEGDNRKTTPAVEASWMTDYTKAESVGMGVTLPISNELWKQLGGEIPRLVVIGEQAADHSQQSILEHLIEGQSDVVDQLGFTEPGTPTNNRKSQKTGVSDSDDHSDEVFDGIILPYITGNQKAVPVTGSDQERFEKALGLSPGMCNGFKGGDNRTIERSKAMNGLMSDLTVGSFLFDFWGTVTDPILINSAKSFYQKYVIARGWLPGIRIERQPYGVLPMTDFSSFNPDFDGGGSKSPMVKGFSFIESLYESFKATAHATVPSKKDMEKSKAPHSYYMGMLNNNPVSQKFNIRTAINAGNRIDTEPFSHALKELVNFQEDDELNADALAQTLSGLFDLESFRTSFPKNSHIDQEALQNRFEYCLSKSRALNLRYLDTVEEYTGNIVSHDELKNALELSDGNNYFEWFSQFIDDPDYLMNLELYDEKSTVKYGGATSDRFGGFLSGKAKKGTQSNNKNQKYEKHVANKDAQKLGGTPIVSSLLFFMARHSLLQMYKREAYQVMQSFGWLPKSRVTHSDGSIVYDDFTRTWGVLFARVDNFIKDPEAQKSQWFTLLNKKTMVELLTQSEDYGWQSLIMAKERIGKYKVYLAEIGSTSIPELKNLFAEQVDLSAHRIDAWRLGFVNKKLDMISSKGGYRVGVTHYGIIEKLTQSKGRTESVLPDDYKPKKVSHNIKQAPVVVSHNEANELIHAPSHDHAVVAGVLKSGYNLSKRSSAKDNNLSAVNLNSRRVRKAMHLVEAMRQGQDVAAYLGFRIERFLHNVNMDYYIYSLRRAFPYATPVNPENGISEGEKELQVVNGMELVLKFREKKFHGYQVGDWPEWALPALGLNNYDPRIDEVPSEHFTNFAAALYDLDDLLDAVTDLTVTEGVYHIVKGNHIEAAAVVNAIGQGKPLPEIGFTKTPVNGVPVHHKTLIHLPLLSDSDYSQDSISGEWGTVSLKGLINPQLNRFCAQQLPEPSTLIVEYSREQLDVEGDIEVIHNTLTLAELGVEPIDFVLSLNSDGGLVEFLSKAVKAYAKGVFPESIVLLVSDAPTTATVLKQTFTLRKIATLMEKSKALVASQFDNVVSEDRSMTLSVDRSELNARLNKVMNFIRIEGRSSAELENIENVFVTLVTTPDGTIVEAANRFAQLVTAGASDMYLQYTTGHINTFYPTQTFTNRKSGSAGMLQMESWLSSVSKVRNHMMNINQMSLLHFHTKGTALTVSPIQFPENNQWFGGELTRSLDTDEQDLSFVVLNAINAENIGNNGATVALVVDEWIEVLPQESHTTGVALHVDQPDAAAPQTLLLAVPPHDNGEYWTHRQMVGVVTSALEMAQVRLVQPHDVYDTRGHIGSRLALSQVLPGMNIEMESDNSSNFEQGTLSLKEVSGMKVSKSAKNILGKAMQGLV
ncbi:MAG: hypothetical protein OCC49_15330 [Fibrobacterales bacterium]